MVPNASVDFVFSFDSLVHADLATLRSYVHQVVTKLRAGGVAFLHHSNLKAVEIEARENVHRRAADVSYALLRQAVESAGGRILVQELVAWGGPVCIDCFSLFCRSGDYRTQDAVVVENGDFMTEADLIRRHLQPYVIG